MDGQCAVRGQPDVELDPVGAQPAGPGEGRERVLPDPVAGSGLPRWACTAIGAIAGLTLLRLAGSGYAGQMPKACNRPRELLATHGAGDYPSERTLNGRCHLWRRAM